MARLAVDRHQEPPSWKFKAVPRSSIAVAPQLSTAMLERGTALNRNSRLRCLVERAKAGSSIHLTSLGTSITAGHGVKKKNHTFAARFADRIRTVSGLVVVEHIRGSASFQPHSIEHCLSSHLPEHTDLVLVEYAVMPDTLGFERVLRRLLSLPTPPAVIVVNLPTFSEGPSPLPSQTPSSIFARNRTLNQLISFDAIAAHYNLPSASLWSAVREEVLRNASNYQIGEMFLESVHPSPAGHELIAQLLSHLLERATRSHDSSGVCPAAYADHAQQLPLPSAFLKQNRLWAANTPAEGRCLLGHELAPWIAGGNWKFAVEGFAGQGPKPGWVAHARTNSSIHLCSPGDNGRAKSDAGYVGTWKVAHLQSYTAAMGSVEASCSGGCTCSRKTIHGWNKLRRNQSQPPHVSYVGTESIVFQRQRTWNSVLDATRRPPDVIGGHCSCMLSLRLLSPTFGQAPYHANLFSGQGPKPGLKFKLVGLARIEGLLKSENFAMKATFDDPFVRRRHRKQ